jgi:thiol-disulfide isomerase/thioredoxin
MKKRLYALIILPVAAIVVLLGVHLLREDKDPVAAGRGRETQRPEGLIRADVENNDKTLSQLFEEMGIVRMDEPVPIPVDIQLPDLNAKQVSFSEFKGKIVFVNFWATWCPPCREEMPSMEKLYTRLKHKDFVMVAVDLMEPASKVEAFFEEFKLTFMALLDTNGEVGSLFGISSIPTTLILDKNGMIIGIAVGPRDWAGKKSIALFEYLIDWEEEPTS